MKKVVNPLIREPTADIVVFIIFPAPFPRRLIAHLTAWSRLNCSWSVSFIISWLLWKNSRIQLCICGIKSAMLVIKVPIVRVSCGITPNITNEITPTTNTTVRSRLIGLDSFLTILFSFFAFLKIVLSKKLIGTLVRNAIAPPSINGNIILHMVFSTPSTISNFHRATTRSAVNTISSLIFLIDILFRSTIFSFFNRYLLFCVIGICFILT